MGGRKELFLVTVGWGHRRGDREKSGSTEKQKSL